MKISNSRGILGFTALAVTLLSFVQFLLFYIPSGFFYHIDILLIAASHLINFFEGLFPVICALIIFTVCADGLKNKILPTALISLTRLAYTIPYYYIYYVADVFNTSESIILSLLVSLLFVISAFLQTFVCIIILSVIEKRANKTSLDRTRAKLFNIDDHLNFGALLCTVISFVIFFVREVINTAEYLIDNAGGYRLDEILTIVIAYLLLFLFAFIHYTVSVLVKNGILKKNEDN